jgi:DNA-binding MarR family transcriptional regulator
MEFEGTPLRDSRLDDIAEALPRRAALLTRMFIKHAHLGISRTEIGVLNTAAEQPQRITELAALEGVTQPAISLVVNRLVERGWVVRESDPDDRRAVLVTLTADGHRAWQKIRGEYRALLHEEMAALDHDAVEALARAVEVLDELIRRLMERDP